MGYAYNCLIVPAVLFDNPRITREQFVALLDKTHSSWIREYPSEAPWDSFYPDEDDENHHGLEGLAQLLGLEHSSGYNSFQKQKLDENGLTIGAPWLLHVDKEDEKAGYKFEVNVHEKNVFEEPRLEESCSWGKLKVGDVWKDTMMGSGRGIVLKIFKEKKYKKRRSDDDDPSDSPSPGYFYKMMIKPFHGKGRRDLFKSEGELWKIWPQFNPDFMFDWARGEGIFQCADRLNFARKKEQFRWVQTGGKYNLDAQTLDEIPASWGCGGSLGYTDLILTAEAVNHQAWKLLSYKGLKHFSQFLKDFPDARARYGRAIWDSHTSLSAKMQGMTHTELLRYRLEPPNCFT